MTVMATRNATAADFAQVMASIEMNGLDTEAWITDRVPPEGMAAAFPRWLDPESGSIKPVVVMG
jgi:threonine dehydrogenase-like Zn-dependent dehydrogenase